MIIVRNRELLIPREEYNIGTNYDGNAEQRLFRIDRITSGGVDLSNLAFRLDLKYANDGTDTAFLDVVEITDDYINMQLNVVNSMLQVPGTVLVQIRALTQDGKVKWTSYPGAFFVEDAINSPAQYEGDLSELEQIEAAISAAETAVQIAEAARVEAENAREAAEELRETAENARQAYEVSRQVSEEQRTANAQVLEQRAATVIDAVESTLEDVREAESILIDIQELEDDLLERLASGEFKGDKGDKGDPGERGESGITAPISGFFTMYVTDAGDLYVVSADDMSNAFYYDSATGNLYFETEDGN